MKEDVQKKRRRVNENEGTRCRREGEGKTDGFVVREREDGETGKEGER